MLACFEQSYQHSAREQANIAARRSSCLFDRSINLSSKSEKKEGNLRSGSKNETTNLNIIEKKILVVVMSRDTKVHSSYKSIDISISPSSQQSVKLGKYHLHGNYGNI